VFSRSAHLYDAVYSFKDYAAEAERLRRIFEGRVPEARTLLDVACGTGMHLAELRRWYEVEGLDLDPQLLAFARERLPDVPLHECDMTAFDLGREFDVVTCLFSSIAYVRTAEGLRAATAVLARHVAPGGLLAIEPWILPEQWKPDFVGAVFVDEPELKVARMNAHGGEPVGDVLVMDFQYLVGTPDRVEHFIERHEVGMFTKEQYLDAVRDAGLDPEWDDEGLMGRGLVLGRRGA
jgi:SAM-dependent methyltransferase